MRKLCARTAFFFVGCLMILPQLLAAEAGPKVAVLDFKTVGDGGDLGEGAAEILRTALVETGRYTIIERAMLEQVLKEQKLSLSGITDQNEAAGIGKLLGAKLVAVGSVVRLGESYTLNIRFVDVETAQVVIGKNLTVDSKEEIPALCRQMVRVLGSTPENKSEAVPEQKVEALPAQTTVLPEQKTPPTPRTSNWSVGLLYPGAALKYSKGSHAWELKAQGGEGVFAAGPRYYRYLNASGLRLFWGLEAAFINFKGKESKGTGFAAGGFAGGEVPLGDRLGLSMDFGPMYISLAENDYAQSVSATEYVLNMAIYWHFK